MRHYRLRTLVIAALAFVLAVGVVALFALQRSESVEHLEGRWRGRTTTTFGNVELQLFVVDGNQVTFSDGCNSSGYRYSRRGDVVEFRASRDGSSTAVGCEYQVPALPSSVTIVQAEPPYFEIPAPGGMIRLERVEE